MADQKFRVDASPSSELETWWKATRVRARSYLHGIKGTRIYVTEEFDALVAAANTYGGRPAFLAVHVVSQATGGMFEHERVVCDPPLVRAFALDEFIAIASLREDAEVDDARSTA